jgi:tetratricopeptide (TPR) repeat protein
MKILTLASAICLLGFIAACQPNTATPFVTTSASTTTPVAPAIKQEIKIEDIRAQVNLKNYGSALDSINEFINRQPANSDAFYLRAKIQSAVGDFSAATISLEQALLAGLSNPSDVLTDSMLVEYRKSASFKQLQAKYSVLALRNDKPAARRPSDDAMIVKAGNITLRLPNN